MKLNITTIINGREVSRIQILEWEQRRARVVLKKLGVIPQGEDLGGLKQQLMARKQALGAEGLLNILRTDLALSGPSATLTAALSMGFRRFSVIELFSSAGDESRLLT